MTKKIYNKFWDNFDTRLYEKYLSALNDVKTARNYRIGKDLDRDFSKKVNKDKNITKTDVIIKSIIEYTYSEQAINMLVTEITCQNERIAELEYMLEQLKSQLLDVYKEDSLIITIIDNALNKGK